MNGDLLFQVIEVEQGNGLHESLCEKALENVYKHCHTCLFIYKHTLNMCDNGPWKLRCAKCEVAASITSVSMHACGACACVCIRAVCVKEVSRSWGMQERSAFVCESVREH